MSEYLIKGIKRLYFPEFILQLKQKENIYQKWDNKIVEIENTNYLIKKQYFLKFLVPLKFK